MDNNSEITDAINDLITVNYDGERGYKESAEDVNDARLKSWFREYAQQRYDFGHELKGELSQLGATPDKGTSLAADVHRMWIDLKAAVAGNDEAAVLDEVIRGERNAIERYDKVLEHNALPASARTVISRQRNQIMAALGKIEDLKRTFATA